LRKRELHIAQEWFQSFLRGEERGFDIVFTTYYKAICFFAKRYTNHSDAAEDIAEESFIKLWSSREQIKDEKHLRNWLYKTAYHGCLRWRERQLAMGNRQKEIAKITEVSEKECTENIIRAETLRQVKEAMEQLPAQCKKVFYKLYIEGKTVAETANELQLTVSTIKNQKARGIKLLRLRLTSLLLILMAAVT